MGLWLVPCGIQHLSLTSSQSCSTPSFNRLLCAALPHQTPCPARQIQHPLLWAALPHPKTPAKCSLPARATRQLFLQQVRKQRRRKGGGSVARQSRAAGMLHQHAEPRATSTVAGQRLPHPGKLLWGKVEIQPQK